jgi:putative ABC transport system permease protein
MPTNRAHSSAWLTGLGRDFQFAGRSLLRRPGLAIVAAATLGLAMGATTAVFSLFYTVLVRSLPYDDPATLFMIRRVNVTRSGNFGVAGDEYVAWKSGQRAFTDLAASYAFTANVSLPGGTDRFRGSAISAGTFSMLGIRPLLGRDFGPGDERVGAEGVVLLGHQMWRNHFGSDPDVVGRPLRINGQPYSIAGVMPEKVGFPRNDQLWVNFQMDPTVVVMDPGAALRPGRQFLRVLGRLRPGVTLADAEGDLNAIEARLLSERGQATPEWRSRAISLIDDQVSPSLRRVLQFMMAAVGFVLVIACANVANLLLGRAVHRTKEVGMRSALGASRAAIVRQFVAESLVVAAVGAIIGLWIAGLAIVAFNQSLRGSLVPYYADVHLYWPVFGFAAVVGVLAGVLSGVLPAWQSSRVDVNDALKDDWHGASSFKIGRASRTLVVAQIALCCILLVVAGLMTRTVRNLLTIERGFETRGIFIADVGFPPSDRDHARQRRFFELLLPRLQALPGARAAALTSSPPGVYRLFDRFAIEGVSYPNEGAHPGEPSQTVSAGFFETFQIAVRRGRGITAEDREASLPVVVVSESFAARHFPGQDPIGRRIRVDDPAETWRTIVGVVQDTFNGFAGFPNPVGPEQFYFPLAQRHLSNVSVAVRSGGDPAALTPLIRQLVASLDPDIPVFSRDGAYTMEQQSTQDAAGSRQLMNLAATLGALAIALAAVGLYSVMSFSVGRRTRELGIRIALGARTSVVVGMVLRQGFIQVAIGTAIGLIAAANLTRVMRTQLFEVEPRDPLVFSFAVVVLALAALVACAVPARRAAVVHPVQALRAE